MSKWNTTKLIAASSLGVVYLILALPGGAIVAITGIPGAGGITNIFFGAITVTFCCLLIRKFGAATVMLSVFSICAIPLPLLGIPGFLPKVLIGISTGLIADSVYTLLRRREKIAAIAIGVVTMSITGLEILGLGLLFNLPGVENLAKFLTVPVIVSTVIVGALGSCIGYIIFNKLRNTAVVKRIQA